MSAFVQAAGGGALLETASNEGTCKSVDVNTPEVIQHWQLWSLKYYNSSL